MNIIVNGKEITVSGDTLTYEEIADIAKVDSKYSPTIVFRKKSGGGIVTAGHRIEIEEWMVFNVCVTTFA